MIDAKQLRAARALLDWKISDLSTKTEISITSLSAIERGKSQARKESIETIQKVLEDAGVEFLPDSGLRLKNRIVMTHEGSGANKLLVEDLYNTLQPTGGEMLVAHVDEGASIRDLDISWIAEQIRKRKEAGITSRMLVQADDPNLIPPFDNYRCVPKEFFSPYPLFVYGSKLALFSWEPSPRVVIIDDARFADSARKLFNFVWAHADPVIRRKA